jgi:hypothetical protein
MTPNFYIKPVTSRIFLMQLTIEQLIDLVDPKNPALLKEWGGSEGLAAKLNTNIDKVF